MELTINWRKYWRIGLSDQILTYKRSSLAVKPPHIDATTSHVSINIPDIAWSLLIQLANRFTGIHSVLILCGSSFSEESANIYCTEMLQWTHARKQLCPTFFPCDSLIIKFQAQCENTSISTSIRASAVTRIKYPFTTAPKPNAAGRISIISLRIIEWTKITDSLIMYSIE